MEKQSRAKEYYNKISEDAAVWVHPIAHRPCKLIKDMNHKTIEDVKDFHNGLTTHTFDHVGWEGVEFILKSDLTELEKLKI